MKTEALALTIALALAPSIARAESTNEEPRHPVLIASGVTMLVAGASTLAVSAPLLAGLGRSSTTCSQFRCATITPDAAVTVGLGIGVVSGALSILGSIPLLYIGARHPAHAAGMVITASGVSGRF